MFFLATVKIYNLEYIISILTINIDDRSKLTLFVILYLIKMLIIFFKIFY